jgi:hypothetical protein
MPGDRCCAPLVYRNYMGVVYQIANGAQCAPSCGGPPVGILCDPASPNPCPGLDAGCRALPFRPAIYYSCQ